MSSIKNGSVFPTDMGEAPPAGYESTVVLCEELTDKYGNSDSPFYFLRAKGRYGKVMAKDIGIWGPDVSRGEGHCSIIVFIRPDGGRDIRTPKRLGHPKFYH